MKILFLDVDGVINSGRTCLAFGGYPHNFTPEHMKMFDHVAIALIRRLCRQTGTQIVLSSTWRMHFSAKEVADALNLPVIDVTPQHDHDVRGDEIHAWLCQHSVAAYAIVDDNSDMLEGQMSHFVHTNEQEGLTLKKYYELRDILQNVNVEVE